jgi:hypothetical protein
VKPAKMTCGPYNGLRLYDPEGHVILHHDANARMALVDRAIDFLRAEVQDSQVVYEIDGERYALEGGNLANALIILRAIRERG